MRVQVKAEVWYGVEFDPDMTKLQIKNKLLDCRTLADIYELKEVSDVNQTDELYQNIEFNPEDYKNIWFENFE